MRNFGTWTSNEPLAHGLGMVHDWHCGRSLGARVGLGSQDRGLLLLTIRREVLDIEDFSCCGPIFYVGLVLWLKLYRSARGLLKWAWAQCSHGSIL